MDARKKIEKFLLKIPIEKWESSVMEINDIRISVTPPDQGLGYIVLEKRASQIYMGEKTNRIVASCHIVSKEISQYAVRVIETLEKRRELEKKKEEEEIFTQLTTTKQ